MTALEAAMVHEQGRAPVPIPFKAKKPVLKKWQTLRLTLETVPAHFNGHEQNIGLILGEASKGLMDADLDCAEARVLAEEFLPPTGCIFGRKSAPRSHWVYVVMPALETQQWPEPSDKTVKDKLMLVELRGTGGQTVFPPSVHPTGESIEFATDGAPAVVNGADLTQAMGRLAAACLLVRYWPAKGVRHFWALALAGGLLRGGWTEEAATHFMHAVLTVAKSEDPDLHLAAIRDTAKKLAAGETDITGWPKLTEVLPERVVEKVREWCGVESVGDDDLIRELNATHAVVLFGGKCLVLTEVEEPDRKSITLSKAADLTTFYKNRRITIGDSRKDIFPYWLAHPQRRQYTRVVFTPQGAVDPGHYNLWRGYAVDEREGNCSKYQTHLREVICSGNATHYDWLLAWMANAVQAPMQRPGTAVVMRGGEGIGKGMMAKWFGRLFGQHYIPLTQSRHVVGNFNAHMREAVVALLDEALWAGDKAGEGILKTLITEAKHMIEHKYADAVAVDNYLHFLISSNHEWAVPAGMDARRFFVLDVSEAHKQDAPYFEALETQMATGGAEALLYELRHHDWSPVNLRHAPQTAALADQKMHSMTPIQKFWFGCLREGSQLGEQWAPREFANYTPDRGWQTAVRAMAFYDRYIEQAKKAGVTRRAMAMEVADALKKMVPTATKKEREIEGVRATWWLFPPLAECRAAFDAYMHWTYPWDVIDLGEKVSDPQPQA